MLASFINEDFIKYILPLVIAPLLSAGAASADMTLDFKWGNIPLCTSGNPNTVGSPEFTLTGVPAGTNRIDFTLKDLDVPSYNHGGGKVKAEVSGSATLPGGIFKYKSPCPPSGSHRYQWKAVAKNGSKTLGTATAMRNYP